MHPCFDEIVAEIYQDSSAFEVSLQSMPAIYKISKEDIELIDIFNNAYSNVITSYSIHYTKLYESHQS